jgi:hypothetical protein
MRKQSAAKLPFSMVEYPMNFAAAKYPLVSDVAKLRLREVGSKNTE